MSGLKVSSLVRKCVFWITYFGSTISKISSFKNALFRYSFVHSDFFCLLTISHEQLSPKPINHTIFCNNSISSLRLKYISQTVKNVLLLSAENTKKQ